MGDVEDTEAAFLQAGEEVEDIDTGGGVEHAGDLVGDQETQIEQERAGDEQALQLAAAELVRVAAEHLPGVQAYVPYGLLHAVRPLLVRDTRVVGAADQGEDPVRLEDGVVAAEGVLEDALDAAVEVLAGTDLFAVQGEAAGGGPGEAEDHAADGGLPAAALADERDQFAGGRLEGDPVDGGGGAAAEGAGPEGLGDAVEGQHQAAFQHATVWRGATSTTGGSSAHPVSASGQRSRKRQPAGGFSREGGEPSMPLSGLSL